MRIISVGMGEIVISDNKLDTLKAPGLGSCIGLVMYDKSQSLAGMAHIVLPESKNGSEGEKYIGKYANVAIPEMLNRMTKKGAQKANLVVKMAGGSQMFNMQNSNSFLNIGQLHIRSLKEYLLTSSS